MTDDLIEYEATAKLYLQEIGEILPGQRFRAHRHWVEILRYVARPVREGHETGSPLAQGETPVQAGRHSDPGAAVGGRSRGRKGGR